ncbi:MAG: flagellar export protein FliJ [Aestuariivirgaceae bacterium]|nr:flagellar export protein FliJ [Aestuariivirgaceae bacterium]
MRSRDTLLRLARFKLQERQRQAMGLESMIAEFLRKQDDLDALISAEEARSGVSDPEHFNYPTTAKAARARRDNLLASVAELNDQLAEARAAQADEESELARLELAVGKADQRMTVSASTTTASPLMR